MMVRSVLAVVCGYVAFALPAVVFFQVSGRDPHEAAPVAFMGVSIAFGVVTALAGGAVAAWLAPRKPAVHAMAVAAMIAGGALASMAAGSAAGARWTQVSALLVFTPCAVLGGWLRGKWHDGRTGIKS